MPTINNAKIKNVNQMMYRYFQNANKRSKNQIEQNVELFVINEALAENLIEFCEASETYRITEKGKKFLH